MGQPLILPVWKFFDAAGLPLAGGKLYSYAAGTSTPQATYTDQTEGTPNTNPLILDANGVGVIWLGSLSYKFILQDSLGNVQWTADGIQTIPNGAVTTVKLADGSVTTVKIADANVTTAKLVDQSVTTAKIADAGITTVKIADGSVTFAKLQATTAIAFIDTSGPRTGDGPSSFPVKPWSSPTPLAIPASPVVGDGQCVSWSPNGKLLCVAENNSEGLAIFSRLGNELVKLSPGFFISSGAPGALASCSFSPDAEYLIAGSTLLQRSGNGYVNHLYGLSGVSISNVKATDWAPSGDHFAIAQTGSTPLIIMKRTDVIGKSGVASYNATAGQSIPDSTLTTIAFANVDVDNANLVTGPAGAFQFHSIRANGFTITVHARLATTTAAKIVTLAAIQNGSTTKQLDAAVTNTTASPLVSGTTWFWLNPGDVISAQISHNVGSPVALTGSASENHIEIREDAGFNRLSTFLNLSSPATLPAGSALACKFSPDGRFLAVGNSTATYTLTVTSANATAGAVYQNGGNNYFVQGTITSGTTLVLAGTVAPTASGTLTRVSGTGDGTITFSSVAPPAYVTIYQRTGDTFAKCADPASLPPGQVNGVAWSPDGLRLTCVHAISPFITTYYRSSVTDTTFVKVSANPATLPAGAGNACAYNSLNTKLAVAHDNSPFLTIYSVSGSGNSTVFTKDADPSTLPTGNGKSVSWTPDSNYLSVGHVSSPYVTNYTTSGSYGSNAITYVNEVDLV